jgi:uncharacterized protein (DUF983 family)
MLYLAVKAVISGILIAVASEVARRFPGWGALIVSLPLVSVLTFIWLYVDTRDSARIAELSQSTFWFFLPSIPLFLALPAMLRAGLPFWLALLLGCALTVALYLGMVAIAPRVGIRL